MLLGFNFPEELHVLKYINHSWSSSTCEWSFC